MVSRHEKLSRFGVVKVMKSYFTYIIIIYYINSETMFSVCLPVERIESMFFPICQKVE